jgi:hypothetical protein
MELSHAELVLHAWAEIDAMPASPTTLKVAPMDVGLSDGGEFYDYMYCDLTNATDLRRELTRAEVNVTNLLNNIRSLYRELDLAATTGSVMSVYQVVTQVVQRGYKQGFIK